MDPTVIIAVGAPIGYAVCCLIISYGGGWHSLARRYPDKPEFTGKRFYFRSGHISRWRGVQGLYGLSLTLCICDEGLRMSVPLTLGIGHPRLFIPWEEFHGIFESRELFFRFVNADVGRPVVASVALPYWIHEYMPSEEVG